VPGTSMGGMIAIVFAGKYPQRTTSMVINCAAANLAIAGRLVFKNWIDIARMDPDGPGSRILAELIAWQALSKAFLQTPDGAAAIDTIQQILRDPHRIEGFTAPAPPPPRRADPRAGPLEGVPRDARRGRRDRHDPADPARLEPDRGVHRRV